MNRCLAKNILGEVEASIKLFETPKSSIDPKQQTLFAKESKSRNKNNVQTMSSMGFDDRGDGGIVTPITFDLIKYLKYLLYYDLRLIMICLQ